MFVKREICYNLGKKKFHLCNYKFTLKEDSVSAICSGARMHVGSKGWEDFPGTNSKN